MKRLFTDRNYKFNMKRKVVSMRDGYQVYFGSEIGMEPPEKEFRIYRDEAEVRKVSAMLVGLPITDNHIDIGVEVPDDLKVGHIVSSEVITASHSHDGTVEVFNDIQIDEPMHITVEEGKRELSLGYLAELEPFGDHFKQVNFEPHHLAIVKAGRCEKSCKFKDDTIHHPNNKKGSDMNKKDVLAWFMALSAIDQKSFADEMGIKPVIEYKDKKVEVPAKITSKERREIGDVAVDAFIDSKEFSDTMKKENEAYAMERSAITDKAKHFLDSDYNFESKSNEAIMSDAVKAEYADTKYEDNEVAVAFKTLNVGTKVEAKVEMKDSADKEKLDKLADEEY